MHRQSGILQRVIGTERGTLAPDLARYVLTLEFPPADQARYAQLAELAQQGTLTTQEQVELDEYLNVNDFLTVVQSKARTSLKNQNPAA
jgi:hypothetical protein